jgi:hypothetical protein
MIFSTIQCDVCGEQLSYTHMSKWLIIYMARKNNWSVGKTMKCPLCKTLKGKK